MDPRLPFTVVLFIAVLVNTGQAEKKTPSTSSASNTDDGEGYNSGVMNTLNKEGPWGLDATEIGVGVYALKGRGSEMMNRYRIIQDGEYLGFAVFDGIRGTKAADQVVRELLPFLINSLKDPRSSAYLPEDVLLAKTHRYGKYAANWSGESGTMAMIGIKHKNKLYLVNIGNIRVAGRVYLNGETKDYWLTEEHMLRLQAAPMSDEYKRVVAGIFENVTDVNTAQALYEIRMAAKHKFSFNPIIQGWTVNSLDTTRALGPINQKETWLSYEPRVSVIDLNTFPLKFVIVGTKALWRMNSEKTAADYIAHMFLSQCYGARSLAESVYARMRSSDITVMVANLDPKITLSRPLKIWS